MSEYFNQADKTITQDDLVSDHFPILTRNVSLSGGTAIERGMILAGASGIYSPAQSSADATKILSIASRNETSDATVTTAYVSGRFHENKLKLGELDIEDFREPLRQGGIYLNELKEWE